jgi:hypothetical protein
MIETRILLGATLSATLALAGFANDDAAAQRNRPPERPVAATPSAPASTTARPAQARVPSGRPSLAPGQMATIRTVAMQSAEGPRVTIDQAIGTRGTLVVFTCNHCPWARAWEARITEIGNRVATQGIGVIAINANDPGRHEEDGLAGTQARARAAGMRFPYAIDETSNVARAFGATKTPEAFLFDATGALVYHGAIDDNAHEPGSVQQHYLRDAVNALIAGRPIPNAETRSVGCGIKFRNS